MITDKMKKYFAKYLPVEGEPKNGDILLCDAFGLVKFIERQNEEFYHCIRLSNGRHISTDTSPKRVKLFLCSKDIQVGDEVLDEDFVKWIVKDTSDLHNIYCETDNGGSSVTCIVQDCTEEGKSAREDLFKVIGEISKYAAWVREGDEFDEDEIKIWMKPGISDSKILTELMGKEWKYEKDYITTPSTVAFVKIKCPTCKIFH